MEQAFKLSALQYKKEPKVKQDFLIKPVPASTEDADALTDEPRAVFKDARIRSFDRTVAMKRLKRVVEVRQIEVPEKRVRFLPPDEESMELKVQTENFKSMLPVEEKKEEDVTIKEDEPEVPIVEEETDKGVEQASTNQAPKKKRAPKQKMATVEGETFNLTIEKIGKTVVADRVPRSQKLTVGVSDYYMNNRKIYISKLAKLFKPYSDRIAEKSAELSCKTLHSQNMSFDLLTHQLVIRDYLNLYTPYRGLLLFHGLGSGKTCTSIGVAEGMKTGKNVVLMTPASLKMNFFNELKKCGDVLYRKNQFWEFVSVEGDARMIRLLSHVLGLDTEYIRANGGAWLMNVKKRANFAKLSDNDQRSVDQQIDAMIRNKYLDINYNGLTKKRLDELTKGSKNPFDNRVVIIDEAHNLVSRISNVQKSKKDKKESIAYILYQKLMDATNAKIVFLSGTPIINTPCEIGILFNMLRGYIKTWSFTVETTTTAKINSEIIMDYFRDAGLVTYDYVEYSANRLTVTRNPFGFSNTYKVPKKRGGDPRTKNKKGTRRSPGHSSGKKTKRRRPTTPRVNESSGFDKTEDIVDNEENRTMTEEYNQLQKDLYAGGGAYDEYAGVHLDEMGNISDSQFESAILRILNHNGIRVVGKPTVRKETCLPDSEDVFNELFINNERGELVNVDLFKRRILGLTSYFRSAQEQLLPSFVKDAGGANYHIINTDMSDHQFEVYETIRKVERDEEQRNRKKSKMNPDDNQTSSYRIYSRSACNFAFPAEYPRPVLKGVVKDMDDFNGLTQDIKRVTDDYFEDPAGATVPAPDLVDYQEKIEETYSFLAYKPERSRTKEYLTEDQLPTYSPKYYEILQNIKNVENRGLHLLYSQFLTLEGIGIFKLILEANGFREFKIVKKGREWEIQGFDIEPEKPRFVLYSGRESAEEKDIVRNIYNGDWDIVPPSITEKLRERNANNLYGEVIKLLMITASGAEGINLRNTRFVHIMEPYWNMVRVDQVVGRARRICSHEDLPEEMRNVKVMIYLSRATPTQIDRNIELRTKDLSKLTYKLQEGGREKTERVPFTTDQYLFEIAQIKDSITRQILTSVKETAIDCSLYNKNPDEPLVCYGFGKTESQSFASYPMLERDTQEKVTQNVKKMELKLNAFKIGDKQYAIDKKTMRVYDYASYLAAKENKGELLDLGVFDMRTHAIQYDK
jgi:hypothetical protein